MKNIHISIGILTLLIAISSCQKYLDAKPDMSLVIPNKLSDLQALLDNDGTINITDPIVGSVACDDYYITPTFYQLVPTAYQEVYNWNLNVRYDPDWTNAYTKIYSANVVLDNINRVYKGDNELSYNSIKGTAYFVRAWTLFSVAQIYSMPYENGKNDGALGMPLKFTSDINDPTTRSTLKETYNSIIEDLKLACQYLPQTIDPVTRPCKASAYAAIATTYLQAQEYEMAELYADSALSINNNILDFNLLDSNSISPISQSNIEVLYRTHVPSAIPFNIVVYKVDSSLYNSYFNTDLRKSIFYQSNADGTYYFKGEYDGNVGAGDLFGGLSVDEMYLIKAECAARLNNLSESSDKLNMLLVKRYKAGYYQEYSFTDQTTALKTVLTERRKELAFRGNRRWWDLRRLNLDPVFAVTMKRSNNGNISEIPPNDLRYAFLIPESVVAIGGVQQNAR